MKLKLQRGLTLIELMIAVTLGMIIVMFITNILITAGRTATQSEGAAQAQENGRFILTWLQMNLRSAGMPYPTEGMQERVTPIAPLCTNASVVPPADGADCSVNATSSNVSDRLAVRRTYVSHVDYKTATSNLDCAGREITVAEIGNDEPPKILTDLYWVDPTNNEYGGALKCATYYNGKIIKTVQEIANGIEGMHVLYGVRATRDFQFRSNINRYVALSDVNTNKLDDIGAIQIAILTRSTAASSSIDKKKRTYILLDAAPVSFEDTVYRHIQSTTIFLSNE